MDTISARQDELSLSGKRDGASLVLRKYSKGQHFPAEKHTKNCMIFLLKGELLLNSNEHPGTVIRKNQFILQAIGSKAELIAIADVEYIIFWFTELPVICEEQYKDILKHAEEPTTYSPLSVVPKLDRVLQDIKEHIDAEAQPSAEYLDLKGKELVYMLISQYPEPVMAAFFFPISSYTESFHYFIMQNYDKVKNVEEFAHLGGYTTTTFRRLFKNMYGIPVYEWILDRKREGILNDLRTTHQRISVISNRYGFESLSHFAHFCKDSFGDTPRSLRKRSNSGEKIGIVKLTRHRKHLME